MWLSFFYLERRTLIFFRTSERFVRSTFPFLKKTFSLEITIKLSNNNKLQFIKSNNNKLQFIKSNKYKLQFSISSS